MCVSSIPAARNKYAGLGRSTALAVLLVISSSSSSSSNSFIVRQTTVVYVKVTNSSKTIQWSKE